MATPFPQRSLAGGEIAPALHSRVDLAKYQTGLKTQRNCTTSKSGGVKNRAGFKWIAECMDSTYKPFLVPFVPSENYSYVLVFENFKMRVVSTATDDYVYDQPRVITALAATGSASVLITSSAHGFSTGDEVWIEGVVGVEDVNNRQLKVTYVSADTFRVTKMDGSATTDITGTWSSGGLIYRVMEVTAPFATEDLPTMQWIQDGYNAVIVHGSYKPQKLTMVSETEWYFTELDLDDIIAAPTVTNNGAAGSVTYWVATSIEKDTIEESLASTATSSSATPTTAAPITLTITHVANADSFCVYKRSNGVYGYIGTVKATGASVTFVDNGITADTTEAPPERRDLAELFEDFNKLEDPATPPEDSGYCISWSPDGTVLAIGSKDGTGDDKYLFLYYRTGNRLTKLSNPGTLPTGPVHGLSWSPDMKYLACAHETTPYITVYSVVGSGSTATFTKLTNPTDLPGGDAYSCAWTPTGRGLFVGTGTDPFYIWYAFDGTTFTKLASAFELGSIPGARINAVSFNPVVYDTGSIVYTEMAIGLEGVGESPLLQYYAQNYLAYANPSATYKTFTSGYGVTFAVGAVHGVSWSPNGRFLAVSHSTSPYVTVYAKAYTDGKTSWTAGYSLTALSDPATLPAGTGDSIAWNADSDLLAVGHTTTPYLRAYRVQGLAQPKLVTCDLPTTAPPGTSYGVSFNPNGLYLSTANADSTFMANYEILLNNPACIATYQQRMVLGNTPQNPLGAWASRVGLPYNFTMSSPIRDDDSLSFTLFSQRPASLKSMADIGRLAMLTTSTEYSAKGGDDGVLRPGEVNPRAHSYNGSSEVAPVVIDNSLVYVNRSKRSVADLVYDYETDGYKGNDLTVFATHLFLRYDIKRIAFQKTPDSILWAVRSDGTLLGLTYVKEHEIMAWHRHDTDGDIEDVCVVPNSDQDAVFVVVKRTIDGVEVRYIERLQTRVIDDIVDAKFVDSCLSYDGRNTTTTTMTLSGGTGWDNNETITCTASAATFASTDVGSEIHIEYGGAVYRLEITAYSNTTTVTCRPQRDIPAGLRSVATDDWSLARKTFTGLWHLEGEDVSAFGDGFVAANPNNSRGGVTVASGATTLDRCYAVVHIGLPYLPDVQMLDVDTENGQTLAGRKKLFSRVILRLNESRGVWVGAAAPSDDTTDPREDLEELKIRDDESMDDPVALYTGEIDTTSPGKFTDGGGVFIRQIDPVPMEILSVCPEIEVGGR